MRCCGLPFPLEAGGGGGGRSSSGVRSGESGPTSPEEVKTNRNELGLCSMIYDSLGLPSGTSLMIPSRRNQGPHGCRKQDIPEYGPRGTYQRYALAVFYYSTSYTRALQQPTGWSSSEMLDDKASAPGKVVCNKNGNVASILLPDHYLSGSPPWSYPSALTTTI
jgi:hypothetical protein